MTLRWTHKPPTVPGWYWTVDHEGEMGVMHVTDFGLNGDLYIVGCPVNTPLNAVLVNDWIAEWAGPIPLPEEPEDDEGGAS